MKHTTNEGVDILLRKVIEQRSVGIGFFVGWVSVH